MIGQWVQIEKVFSSARDAMRRVQRGLEESGTAGERVGLNRRKLPAPSSEQEFPASSFQSLASRIWWTRRDSNPRPPGCKPDALPTELRAQKLWPMAGDRWPVEPFPASHWSLVTGRCMAGVGGFAPAGARLGEPPTSRTAIRPLWGALACRAPQESLFLHATFGSLEVPLPPHCRSTGWKLLYIRQAQRPPASSCSHSARRVFRKPLFQVAGRAGVCPSVPGAPQHVHPVRHCHASLVGVGGFEPPTSPLSGVRSSQLSYTPTARLLIILPQSRAMDTHAKWRRGLPERVICHRGARAHCGTTGLPYGRSSQLAIRRSARNNFGARGRKRPRRGAYCGTRVQRKASLERFPRSYCLGCRRATSSLFWFSFTSTVSSVPWSISSRASCC